MSDQSTPLPVNPVETINHLFDISRCFFEAFKVKEHRMQVLKFLIAVLRKDAEGLIDDDFGSEELAKILSGEILTLSYGKHILVKRFANSRGAFLKPGEKTIRRARERGAPLKVKTYTLTDAFKQTVIDYARNVLEVLKLDISADKLDGFLSREGYRLGKETVLFLTDHYWKAWDTLVKDLRDALPAPEAFSIELNNRAAYWTVLFVAWRHCLQRPNVAILESTFHAESHNVLREVSREEVASCLSYLVDQKIISEVAADEKEYHLNPSCFPALRKYTARIAVEQKNLLNWLYSRVRL